MSKKSEKRKRTRVRDSELFMLRVRNRALRKSCQRLLEKLGVFKDMLKRAGIACGPGVVARERKRKAEMDGRRKVKRDPLDRNSYSKLEEDSWEE